MVLFGWQSPCDLAKELIACLVTAKPPNVSGPTLRYAVIVLHSLDTIREFQEARAS